MKHVSPRMRGATARTLAGLTAAGVLGLGACQPGSVVEPAPSETSRPAASTADRPAQLRNAAFLIDVNVNRGTVRITKPAARLSARIAQAAAAGGPTFSILADDAIQLTASNFFASVPGALTPNRREVLFELRVTNLLPGISLITPTFPTAPAGQTGLILFPFSTNVTTTTGGVGTTGGNEVVIELPSRGEVVASREWNGNATFDKSAFPGAPGAGGEPHNFFNDTACPATSDPATPSDCFRYETFGNVGPLATVPAPPINTRRVGFTIDASVGEFRARIIAAADLLPGAVGTGTVSGTISSPQRGPLAGVTVAVSGFATTATTDAAGSYTIAGVPTALRTVSISNLPAGCSTISPLNGQAVQFQNGVTETLNYSVTCTALTGTLNATITRTGTGTQALDGISYTIDPDAAALANVTGQVFGLGFTATVPVGFGAGAGAGTVALGNLPAGCTSSPATYTGLTPSGSVAVALTVDCAAGTAATRYLYSSQWGAIVSGQADLTISFDPRGQDFDGVPGVDAFAGAQAVINLSGSAASRITGRSAVSAGEFGTATLGGTPTQTAWTAVTTNVGGFTTARVLAVIRYSIGSGAPGLVSTGSVIQEINDPDGGNLPLVFTGAGQNIDVIEGTLSIP